jgi:hypothetical protein
MKILLAAQEVNFKVAVKVKEDKVVKAEQTGKMALVITRIAIILALAAARLQPNSLVKNLQSRELASILITKTKCFNT